MIRPKSAQEQGEKMTSWPIRPWPLGVSDPGLQSVFQGFSKSYFGSGGPIFGVHREGAFGIGPTPFTLPCKATSNNPSNLFFTSKVNVPNSAIYIIWIFLESSSAWNCNIVSMLRCLPYLWTNCTPCLQVAQVETRKRIILVTSC